MNTPTSKVEALREELDGIRKSFMPNQKELDALMQAFATFLEGLELPLEGTKTTNLLYIEGFVDGTEQSRAALHQVVTALRGGE